MKCVQKAPVGFVLGQRHMAEGEGERGTGVKIAAGGPVEGLARTRQRRHGTPKLAVLQEKEAELGHAEPFSVQLPVLAVDRGRPPQQAGGFVELAPVLPEQREMPAVPGPFHAIRRAGEMKGGLAEHLLGLAVLSHQPAGIAHQHTRPGLHTVGPRRPAIAHDRLGDREGEKGQLSGPQQVIRLSRRTLCEQPAGEVEVLVRSVDHRISPWARGPKELPGSWRVDLYQTDFDQLKSVTST
jgi:hypothetical protein